MTTIQPTIVICSGSFHTPRHYEALSMKLSEVGFEVECPHLPTMQVSDVSASDISNQTVAPLVGWHDGYADAKVICQKVETLASAGKHVILVGHSYGGWVATESTVPDLQLQRRVENGLAGGIVGIFYISGYILPVGQSIDSFFSPQGDATLPPPFVTLGPYGKSGLVIPVKTEEYFFHDLPEEEAKKWAGELRAQPVIKSVLQQASYIEVPCGYLYCQTDKVFPLFVQEMMVKTARSQGGKVSTWTCEAGHVPFLSMAGTVAEAIIEFAKLLE